MFPLLLACAADPLSGLLLGEEDPSDGAIAGLSEDWLERFQDGDALFEATFREADGLGPLYIRASCASCHQDDGRGPGTVSKMALPDDPEEEALLLPWGHTERPYLTSGATTPLLAPEDPRLLRTVRHAPPTFGRGYLEAVADETLLALQEDQAAGGRVSGRAHLVRCGVDANPGSRFPSCSPEEVRVGRFGLKARIATLDGFAADAFQGDMGITSPLRPTEPPNPDGLTDDRREGIDLDQDSLDRVADYVRLLAIPQRPPVPGEDLFERVGCADCHVPRLPTRADWPVSSIAGQQAELFSDLLLHEMGAAFSDGISDGGADGGEWKTAPLMGLRFLRAYLHDGRAATVEEAILAHGEPDSEALPAVLAFEALDDADRQTLLSFVETR